ncbi:unnamed protein product [Penicillium nalgiovense]|nr:unnamed protein product [Penicillium nalgiovense]
MAKNHKAFREQTGHCSEVQLRAAPSCYPLGLLGLDLKMIGTLSDRRLGCTSIRKCLQMMSIVEEEIQKAQEEREEEGHKHCQLLEQFKAEKADEASKLQLVIAARDAALADNQRVRHDICELQQQLESTNAALQDQVPWNDIRLVLDQAHGDMVSTTTRLWNTIDALQNRRLASYLPGSGVVHADWAEQSGPATQGHDVLLSLSESNVPLPSQQEPSAINQHGSLV